MGRKTKGSTRMKKYRGNESEEQRLLRLKKNAKRNFEARLQETPENREKRLRNLKCSFQSKLNHESPEEKQLRVDSIHARLQTESTDDRARRLNVIHSRLQNESANDRERRLSVINLRLENESIEERNHRLGLIKKRLNTETTEERHHRLGVKRRRLEKELPSDREARLADMKAQYHHKTSHENADERNERLRRKREETCTARNSNFFNRINHFADVACAVCEKMLYPKQRTYINIEESSNIFPPELEDLGRIVSCNRCASMTKKRKVPPQAYWNKMKVVPQPPELSSLTDIEQRLLSRITPFMKIVKMKNKFSQKWCKGQVVLFAQDVAELADQLPLNLSQAGILIISERKGNLEQHKELNIDIDRIKIALQWLLNHNVLYRDVKPNFNNILDLDISQIIRISGNVNLDSGPTDVKINDENKFLESYKILNENASILRGTFNQGNSRFSMDTCGKQCTAIAAVACVAFNLSDPETWVSNDLDYILILGDKFYRQCIMQRPIPDEREVNFEYLAATELLSEITFHQYSVAITPMHDHAILGHLITDRSTDGFPNLMNGLTRFFNSFTFGIVTSNAMTVCIGFKKEHYWLLDSHARGPKGRKANSNGVSCCIRIKTIQTLFSILFNNLRAKQGPEHLLNVFSLTPVIVNNAGTEHPNNCKLPNGITETDVVVSNHSNECDVNRIPSILEDGKTVKTHTIFSTSMLHNCDGDIPDLSSIVNFNVNSNSNDQLKLVDIHRKTAPPINIERERRMEELSWYFLYPDGKNGFGEQRNVPITPLDYFQARVMGSDKRFHRTDYLFFALSVVEYYRTKSSVSVSCRFKKGEGTPQGLVDNIHLTMRNIRGSAAYWKRCCAELIAMVRSLGAPTWFATFSCNDLNWEDMTKALLIADGRFDIEPEELSYQERLELVEKYPVVISRQFMLRVSALISFIKCNNEIFGGPVVDYWYRIEFQNRGSPHLHMLLWCNGIPDFNSEEGIGVINNVISCSLRGDNHELVKRLQVHRHSDTCYKDRSTKTCRFGFPRPVSDKTECLGPDETIANNGRFCILERTIDEIMVNNYNPVLLQIWEANMDIQPCGSVTAVAYYIAKYASKCEPTECGDVIKEAVTNAKRNSNDLWRQLFSVSMAILKRRLVSAPEAAYRLCHLPLKMCSRKTVFVNSCRPEDRYRLLRFENDDTSVFNNIFDKYEERPDELEGISLAEFAVRYESIGGVLWSEDEGDIELQERDNEERRLITLRNKTKMRVRNKPAILRHRYYTITSDRDNFFYSLLVLHVPFRNEKEIMEEHETPEACFIRRQAELKPMQDGLSAEDFAHAEQVIQQALAQAVGINAIIEDEPRGASNSPRVPLHDESEYCLNEQIEEELENITAMKNDVFLRGIKSLNNQQKKIMGTVNDYIRNDMDDNCLQHNPLLIFVTGGAGSGKSFLLKLIVEHIRRCYAPTEDVLLKPLFVEVASLTGVAARQIGGRTLHSVFSLPIEKGKPAIYHKMNGERLERERRKWRFIRWLVIDEVSMVSYENLRIIHLRLQEFKNNDLLFGGINVILLGDIMQLPPVKGHWCFEQPDWLSAEIHLWREFKFYELTTNMRQREDIEFIDILNNLRFGELTTSQLEILCDRRLVNFSGEFSDGMAVRIFPTLKLVSDYNSRMTELLNETIRVYSVHAVDESREAATYGKRPPNNVIPSDINNCGGLLHSIEIAIGSRVMLRRNLCISDGLVNGVMGVIKKLKWPALRHDQLETGELPDAVFVEFDDSSIGQRRKNTDGLVPISPTSVIFQANKGYGDVERRMLPFILSWAVTVHKLQGTTLTRAVIDLGKQNFAKGQVYVALSRVKTLEGLAISDLDSRKLLVQPHDKKALNEMQRLRQCEHNLS